MKQMPISFRHFSEISGDEDTLTPSAVKTSALPQRGHRTLDGPAGIDHVIIDKTHHPRSHVGESLSYSANRILEEIGFLEVMERETLKVLARLDPVPAVSIKQL